VHELLVGLDFGRPVVPDPAEIEARLEAHGAPANSEIVADLAGLVERFAASAMRERLARAQRVRTELPFVYTLGLLL
jgi:hypothetical protein